MRLGPASGKIRVIPLLVAFLLFIVPAPSMAITAGDVEITGLHSIKKEEFLNMFCTKKGGVITPQSIREGIKRAFLKGIFEDIIVKIPDGNNPTVSIAVKERDFIRKITVSGNSAVPAKVVRGLFLLKEGQMMRYDLTDTAIRELKESMEGYGYPHAAIAVRTAPLERPNLTDLELTVNTGNPLIIRSLKISVVPPFPALAGDFARRISLSVGDVYNRYKLEDDLKKVKEYLKKNGYFKAVAGPYSYKDGDLEIEINPGSHMTLRVQGNSVISAKDLIREVPYFEIEDFNDAATEEAIARMNALYHKKGYAFVQIAPVVNSEEGNITVSFFVYEGEKIKVGSIAFRGNTLPVEKLRNVMSARKGGPYDPDITTSDRDAIKELYRALGYLDAAVKDLKVSVDKEAKTANITAEVEEGKKTEIGSVEVAGIPPVLRDKLLVLAGIKPGDPYNETDIADARFRMLEFFDNEGRPATDILVSREIDNYKALIVFRVTEGAKEYFGKTIVTGNRRTNYEVIRRELAYKEGQPYSFRALSEERQKLYKLGLFTEVDVGPDDGAAGKKDILIKVEEGNAGAVDFGFGYADYEKYRGFAEVSYRNLWGMNRTGLLRAEASSLENRFILQYSEPWFLGVALPFRAFLLYENREELNLDNKETLYKLTRYGTTAGVEKKIGSSTKAELYYEFSLVNTRDVKPDVVLTKEDTGTLAISGIKPSIVYDTRDNPFDPGKGIFAGISMKAASFLLLSETNFLKMEAYASHFRKLSKWFTLALSARTGLANGYLNTDQLPLVERFFLGGRSTVRGYAQDTLGPKGADGNPTGGNAYLMANVEMRTSLGKGFGIVNFVDMGNVWQKVNQMSPGELKYTTGAGLRYSTPVGPLRVDYGFKLNREPGESRGELHFSIGQAF